MRRIVIKAYREKREKKGRFPSQIGLILEHSVSNLIKKTFTQLAGL